MVGPYISRVQIKNFRNFKDIDVSLTHKQVIIGENNVGKTNFLRALQLILDPDFSDRDRFLDKSDFHDSISDPMKNGETIEIKIEVRGYENNTQLLAVFQDGVVADNPPTFRITYLYEPIKDDQEKILKYQFKIFLGDNPQNHFTAFHRVYFNIQVIKALRDVEREMKGLKKSPIFRLVDQFDIKDNELENIAENLSNAADSIMELDELIEIRDLIQNKFKVLSGSQPDCDIHLSTFDIDPIRLLQALQVLMGGKRRPVTGISLGLCNILYITLMLLLLRDKTVPPILKEEIWNSIQPKDKLGLLNKFYTVNEKGNYLLRKDLVTDFQYQELYFFLNKNLFKSQTFTVLAVEEAEAHLHPVLQRLIYREVLQKSENSVIFTTHSTHLTSVAPIDSIVHFRANEDCSTQVLSTARLRLEAKEKLDLERYLDARRAEMYFGSGVIFVEGIAEEYLVPKFAGILGLPLDNSRIVVCNINSTNFKPYIQLVNSLQIPWCVITDGDYYELEGEERNYHKLRTPGVTDYGSLGIENIERTLRTLEIVASSTISTTLGEKRALCMANGCFVGNYTLEVDIMKQTTNDGREIIKNIFDELRTGGARQKINFDDAMDAGEFWKALSKLEGNEIGKGRFSQRLASYATIDLIPKYIFNAIQFINKKVNPSYESVVL